MKLHERLAHLLERAEEREEETVELVLDVKQARRLKELLEPMGGTRV